MIKRIIRKFMFFTVCILCLTVYCECDDDHHHDFDPNESSLRQDEQHKVNRAQNLPASTQSSVFTVADVCEKDSVHSIVSVAEPVKENDAVGNSGKTQSLKY